MSHYGDNSNGVKHTPKEWLPVGKQIGQLVNKWSGRSDLVVYVGGQLEAPVPALYNPRSSEVEVNTEICFGKIDPARIDDLSDSNNHYEFPKGIGAIYHEACHARFSLWSLENASKALKPKEVEALHLLEESRIESFGAKSMPRNKYFLSACALEIVIGEVNEEALSKMTSTSAMARLAGLVLARVDAGILELSEVSAIAKTIEDTLGSDLLGKLQDLWLKAQAHDNHANADDLYPLAIEWAKLVSDRETEKGETPSGESGEAGEAGNGSGMSEKTIEQVLKEIAEAKDNTEIKNNTKLSNQQISEAWSETAKERKSSADENAEHIKASQRVFGEPETIKDNKSRSRLVETRKPTSAERASAITIAKWLEKARYRSRTEVRITSEIPQGRLRSRAIVQREALRSKGIRSEVPAWRRTARKHTDLPTLTIGVMVDVSGSMGDAMLPMAQTAWIMSEAGRRVQAKTAMVNFGDGVFGTLRKGQRLDEVKIYGANDGTEKFDLAFQALNGELDLLNGSGARLLVVVSDACYTGEEIAKAKSWLNRCKQVGIGVLWITYDHGLYAKKVCENSNAVVIVVDKKNPLKAIEIIGKAGAEALTKAGKTLR